MSDSNPRRHCDTCRWLLAGVASGDHETHAGWDHRHGPNNPHGDWLGTCGHEVVTMATGLRCSVSLRSFCSHWEQRETTRHLFQITRLMEV